jgi:hypothetical protein
MTLSYQYNLQQATLTLLSSQLHHLLSNRYCILYTEYHIVMSITYDLRFTGIRTYDTVTLSTAIFVRSFIHACDNTNNDATGIVSITVAVIDAVVAGLIVAVAAQHVRSSPS